MADELGRVELVVEVKTEGLQAQFDAVKTQIESVDNIATITPKIGDKSKFNQQLADIRKQLRSVADYKVGVGYLSLTNAVKEAERLRQKLDSFASNPAEVKVTANLEELNRQIAAVDATLEALKDPRPIQLRAEVGAIDDAVAAVDRALEQLRDARPILLKADTGNVDEAVAAVEAAVNRLRDGGQVLITADIRDALSDIELLNSAIAQERKQPPVVLTTDIRDALSDIELLSAAIDQERRQPAIQVTADTSAAIAELDAVRDLAATVKLPVPLELLTGDAYADLEKFRSAAAQPIKAQLTLEESNASSEASTLRSDIAKTPAPLPVDLQTDAAKGELSQLRTEIGRSSTIPLNADPAKANAALAAFRKAAVSALQVPLTLKLDAGRVELASLREQPPIQLPVELVTEKAYAELDQLRTAVAQPTTGNLSLDPTKANTALATFRKAAAAALQIPLSAVTKQAEAAVQALRSKLSTSLPIEVTADTSAATSKIEALQADLAALTSKTYTVEVQVQQSGQNLDFLKSGKFAEATRGADVAGLAAATVEAQQAAIIRDELLQRIDAPRRTPESGDFGNKGLRQFLEATGGVPENITSKSVRTDLQAASRQRLQRLPDQTLLDLAQTLRSINAKLGAPGGAGGGLSGPTPGGNNRSWLDQVARMVLTMAGLDDATIRQQVQQQRIPNVRELPDLWGPGIPVPFQPARPPSGTPLLTGVTPIERVLLRDPALRDPRRLLTPDGGLDQPQRFEARRRANDERNAAQFQEQRLQSDLANNAERSRRLLPSGLDSDLQEILRNAANAFTDAVRRGLNEAIRQVEVRDLGTGYGLRLPSATAVGALPVSTAAGRAAAEAARQKTEAATQAARARSAAREADVRDRPRLAGGEPFALLPDSTAIGRQQADAARRKSEEATQAARARSAAREAGVREQLLLPPAIGNFDTRRRADTQRRAQDLVDAGQLQPGRRPTGRAETPVQALQRQETRRNAAEFRLAQRRFQRDQRDAEQAAQAQARQDAIFAREQEQAQKKVAAKRAGRNKKLGDAASNALIGGAFPALFGQGLGASVGGALGGAVGAVALPGAGGFAGSLIGTAAGASFDSSIGALQSLANAFDDPIKAFQELQQAALFSSKAVEKNVQALIAAGRTEEAAARTRLDLLQQYGTVDPLGEEPDKLRRAFSELGVTMAQLAAGPLSQLAGVFEQYLRFISTVPRGVVKLLGGPELLPDNEATPEQLEREQQAIRTARARSKQLFGTSMELARLGGQPDTIANQERAFELQLQQNEQREQADLNAADQTNKAGLRDIRQRAKIDRLSIKAQRDAFRLQNQRALEDAQLAGGRQIEDAQIGLRNDRETLRFIRPEQSGSELAVTTRQEQQALLLNRDRAFQNLTNAQDRDASPAEIETATSAFKTAQLDYERGVLKSAKALATAAGQIEDSIRGLTRQREDLSTGLTATAGSDEEGINKYITPQQRRNRQEAADRKLSEEANQVAQALGVKATFTGDIGQQNAQKADFIQKGRQELRGNEDLATLDKKLGDLTTSMTEVKTSIDAQTAAATQLKEATDKLTGKSWIVNVNVNSGSVSGDGRPGQIAV